MPSDFTKFLSGFQRGRPIRGAGRAIGQGVYMRGQEKRERERLEQERRQREQLAKIYGIEGSREGIAYIAGDIKEIEDAFKAYQARTAQPEQPKPSELLKQEGARKQLRVGGMMQKVLPGLIGAHGKEGFAKMAEPQVGRPTLETLGILPPKPKVETAKAPRALTKDEKTARYTVQAKAGTLKDPEKREYLKLQGIDPDTGLEKMEKEGIYSPEIEKKREQAMSILKDMDKKLELSPGETVVGEAAQAYLDSTMTKYGAAGFVSGELSAETQAYFKKGGWKTLEDFKASPEYQMLMANGAEEQIDQMEEDAESYFGGGL